MERTAPLSHSVATGVAVEYVTAAELAVRPPEWWRGVLGVAGFSEVPTVGLALPMTAGGTPVLSGAADQCEVWRAVGGDGSFATRMFRGVIHYRCGNGLMFGCLRIDERLAGGQEGAKALLQATDTAYQNLFALLDQTGYRHLVRIWNYVPDINRDADGEERYRHFNTARQRAFREAGRATTGTVPAASALGSPAGSPISIYFIAAHRAARMIENPRQTSAYHYPPQFGRHSPIFSRACLWGDQDTNLFISGTASIVGHETLHAGDVVAQTRETLANIDALLDEANRIAGGQRFCLEDLRLKVYVRRPADLPAIVAVLADRARFKTAPAYLRADVCREELLVEIEAAGVAVPS